MMKRDNAEKRVRKSRRSCWTSGGYLLRFHLTVLLILTLWSNAVSSIDLTKLLQHRTLKRTGLSLITRFSTVPSKSPVMCVARYLFVKGDLTSKALTNQQFYCWLSNSNRIPFDANSLDSFKLISGPELIPDFAALFLDGL